MVRNENERATWIYLRLFLDGKACPSHADVSKVAQAMVGKHVVHKPSAETTSKHQRELVSKKDAEEDEDMKNGSNPRHRRSPRTGLG